MENTRCESINIGAVDNNKKGMRDLSQMDT